MIELRLFGGFEMTGPDRERARSVAAQPRRAALLAYLAIEGLRGPVRRDQLTALFWPDAEPENARQSLRQALAFLRKALGDRAIVTQGDVRGAEVVSIDPIEVRCDVPALERYLDAGDLVRGVELYRGDLLAGFASTGLTGFDRWLDEQRDDYRQRVRLALRTLSAQAEAERNPALAIQWLRRELALEPADEDAAMRLMGRVAAEGRREEALHIYEEQRRALAELDDDPSPEMLELVDSLRQESPPSPVEPTRVAPPVEAPRNSRRAIPLGGMLAAAVLVIGVVAVSTFRQSRDDASGSSRRTLAIVPFRVSGADPSLAYLGSGVVDLFANRLGADPGWNVASSARGSNGDVLTGAVVGNSKRLVVEATLKSATDSAVFVAVSEEGPVDSISTIVDRVAAKLLFHHSGYTPAFPDRLARRPLPVLQDFLRGYDALRQGHYAAALPAFERAVGADSGFAQAWLGLGAAGRRLGEWAPWQRGLTQALARRDELGRADSLYLIALAGPQYPRASGHMEFFTAWQAAVDATPNRPEGWYELGDYLLRWGPVIGIADSRTQARAALARALSIDSGLVEPVLPLMELAIGDGDTATVERLRDRYLTPNSTVDARDYLLWRTAIFLGDSSSRRSIRASLPRLSYTTLLQIVGMAQVDGIGLDDAQRAVAILRERSVRTAEAGAIKQVVAYWDLNRGDVAAVSRDRVAPPTVDRDGLRLILFDALYAGGDTVVAKRAMAELVDSLSDTLSVGNPGRIARESARDGCATEQWRLWHGQRTNAAAMVARLRALKRPENEACAYAIAAIDAVLNKRSDAREKLETLDLQSRAGPQPMNDVLPNLVAAALWERMGEPRRALAAVRRRPYHHWGGPWYLAALLEAEQRLSRVVGDKASEQRAAAHLAALRSAR